MRSWILTALGVTAVLCACSGAGGSSGMPCNVSDDCSGGMECVQDAPLSECPAGSGCGAPSCVSRCRPVCGSTSECPSAMSCTRRFAVLEQTKDCDAIVGDYVQVCTPSTAEAAASPGDRSDTLFENAPRRPAAITFCAADVPGP